MRVSAKDRILDSALELFAEYGYDGVGVDRIAQQAGMKGPSMYRHFSGKEDLLNALIDRVELYYEQNFGSTDRVGDIPADTETFVRSSMNRILFTMKDPMIRKVRRVLISEQFRNPRIAALATKHNMTGLRDMYALILRGMMENGTVRRDDPSLLALVLIAPVSLMIQACDRQPEYEQQATEEIERHIRHFMAVYGMEKEQ